MTISRRTREPGSGEEFAESASSCWMLPGTLSWQRKSTRSPHPGKTGGDDPIFRNSMAVVASMPERIVGRGEDGGWLEET